MCRKEMYVITSSSGMFWAGNKLGWVDNIISAMAYSKEELEIIEQLPIIGHVQDMWQFLSP